MHPRLLLALVPLLAVLPAAAANAPTVGYVDMQQVLEQSTLGKKVQEQLRKDFEPKGKALAEQEQSIRQDKQALDRDAPLMTKDQAGKKEEAIKKRIEAYQKEATALQQQLMKVQQEKGREVIGPAQKAVNAVAKQKKLGVVLERSMAGLLYMDETLNVTADIIKYMDANAK